MAGVDIFRLISMVQQQKREADNLEAAGDHARAAALRAQTEQAWKQFHAQFGEDGVRKSLYEWAVARHDAAAKYVAEQMGLQRKKLMEDAEDQAKLARAGPTLADMNTPENVAQEWHNFLKLYNQTGKDYSGGPTAWADTLVTNSVKGTPGDSSVKGLSPAWMSYAADKWHSQYGAQPVTEAALDLVPVYVNANAYRNRMAEWQAANAKGKAAYEATFNGWQDPTQSQAYLEATALSGKTPEQVVAQLYQDLGYGSLQTPTTSSMGKPIPTKPEELPYTPTAAIKGYGWFKGSDGKITSGIEAADNVPEPIRHDIEAYNKSDFSRHIKDPDDLGGARDALDQYRQAVAHLQYLKQARDAAGVAKTVAPLASALGGRIKLPDGAVVDYANGKPVAPKVAPSPVAATTMPVNAGPVSVEDRLLGRDLPGPYVSGLTPGLDTFAKQVASHKKFMAYLAGTLESASGGNWTGTPLPDAGRVVFEKILAGGLAAVHPELSKPEILKPFADAVAHYHDGSAIEFHGGRPAQLAGRAYPKPNVFDPDIGIETMGPSSYLPVTTW